MSVALLYVETCKFFQFSFGDSGKRREFSFVFFFSLLFLPTSKCAFHLYLLAHSSVGIQVDCTFLPPLPSISIFKYCIHLLLLTI